MLDVVSQERLLDPSESWYTVPAWSLLRPRKVLGRRDLPLLSVYREHGVIFKDSRDDNHNRDARDIEVYQEARPGDVVINKMKAWQGSAAVSKIHGLVSPDYLVMEFTRRSEVAPHFFHYLLRSDALKAEYAKRAYGVRPSQWRLMYDDFRSICLRFPSREAQEAICDYLNRKTAAIDALIEKKQKLVELLAEKQRSVVDNQLWQDEACNKEVQLVYLVSLLSGFAAQSEHFSREDRDIRLLRGVNISPNGLRWDDVVRWPAREAGKLKRYLMRPGDIVLGMDRPWISDGLRIATIQEQDCPCLLVQRVARLRVGAHLSSRYLKMALQSKRFQSHLEPETTGVSVPHISGEQILSFRVPLPSLERQDSISASLCSEISKLEELIRKVVDQICRLQEYRQSLITAAVTGQLEIPEEPQE